MWLDRQSRFPSRHAAPTADFSPREEISMLSQAAPDVLIADNDSPLRSDLRLLLEEHGYTCAEAANSREAVEAARRLRPQCLLLDLAMPEMDGLAVARALRSDPATSGIHIHCLTGLGDRAMVQKALEIGCESYLTKPVTPRAVLEVVRQGVQGQVAGRVAGLSLSEAGELLDWLERQGCSQLEVKPDGDNFSVSCLCPPGFRLERGGEGAVRLSKR
jgi:CheY-like chemotaxis protein